MKGKVYLVGAGPGDPGLLTLRGAELLGRADVLVYDYLAAPEIMRLTKEACRKIYVGKMAGNHAKTQDEINQILVDEAKAGQTVVRLKGGDPYIFGRGGEEGEVLKDNGLEFEEVPGISSTIAAAAYAGIPLTHRNFSSQAVLMTGHEKPEKESSAHDWAALAKMGTLAMVMGVKNLKHICEKLMEHGRTPETPAALIQWGTTSRQRTVTATLKTLAQKAEEEKIGAPSLLVIGEVVSLRKKLNWFEKRPLFGKKILVTRSRQQASALSAKLLELGAEVWERPTIEIKALDKNNSQLEEALKNLKSYQWLIFTSPNGAEIFLNNVFQRDFDARNLAHLKIAVIGPGTGAVLRKYGLKADLVPEKFVAENLLAALQEQNISGQKILLARALKARDVLPQGLEGLGSSVDIVPLYETVKPEWAEPLPGAPDLVTFTSASTALGLAEIINEAERANFKAVSIGPITSQKAKELGFTIVAEAEKATIDELTIAILKYCE